MKKIIKNKKLLLIFLTAILLLILFSNYIKTNEIELKTLFDQENKAGKKELLLEADKKVNDQESAADQIIAAEVSTGNKNENKVKTKEIEKIALVKEIKDPFQAKVEQTSKAGNFEEKSAIADKLKIDLKEDLIYLERNIISENISSSSQKSEEIMQSKIKSGAESELKENSKNESAKNRKSLQNIKLPFKLMGIIKNKDNSSALFFYRGQTLLKREEEKIDIFKIEKINNKNLLISYQEKERRLNLWEEKSNEK